MPNRLGLRRQGGAGRPSSSRTTEPVVSLAAEDLNVGAVRVDVLLLQVHQRLQAHVSAAAVKCAKVAAENVTPGDVKKQSTALKR